jgi:membrane protease YdiL (CAAX protease family)
MKLSPTFLRFLGYAKQPVYYGSNVPVSNRFKTFWELFKVNLWSLVAITLLGIVFEFVGELIGLEIPKEISENDWGEVFFIVITAPLFEELLFRWPLRHRHSHKETFIAGAILFSVAHGELYRVANFDKIIFWGLFLVGNSAVILALNHFKEQISQFRITNFKWIYWAFGLVFGLIHLGNYDGSWSSFIFFTPVLCLSQIFGGLLLGYARMRYGFWYGVALHAANNTIPAIFIIIELLTKK